MLPYTLTGNVATITIPDLQSFSRLESAPALSFRDTLWEAADDDRVKTVAIKSGTEHFCPRLDQPATAQGGSNPFTELNEAYLSATGAYQALAYCKKVTVAVVHGECAEAGALIATYADMVLASEDALFYPPGFSSSVQPNAASVALTVRLNAARAWMIGNEPWTAPEALALGFVNRVAPRGQLDTVLADLTERISLVPLDALVVAKLEFGVAMDLQGVAVDFDAGPFLAAQGVPA